MNQFGNISSILHCQFLWFYFLHIQVNALTLPPLAIPHTHTHRDKQIARTRKAILCTDIPRTRDRRTDYS